MRRLIARLFRRPHRDYGLIEMERGTSKVGNATSILRFQGHAWSLVPAGKHRTRNADDVKELHWDLREAMRRGLIVPTVAEGTSNDALD